MFRAIIASFFLCVTASAVWAQQTWVQVEAHPSLRTAEDRARAYTTAFSEVVGYRLPGGWYALALGPYPTPNEARSRLLELRRGGVIPQDSYISDGATYRNQFWPVGAAIGSVTPEAPSATPEEPAVQDPVAEAEPAAPVELDETPREARASERTLDRGQREALQVALKWFGFYTSGIDGAFGRGTRASMGRWQESKGFDVTGILTTKQRAVLLQDYESALAALGLGTVDEQKAGIQITMPAGLVEFDGYEYPFVQYREKDGSGVQVLLISQAGDEGTLAGLYEIMQTLEIVPLEGERRKRRSDFTLRGVSDTIQSYTYAKLSGGYVKGFTLVYPAAKAGDMERVIKIMQDSFATSEGTLEPTDGDEEAQSVDLLSGLELRKPKLSRSGFYVDGRGRVLTVADAVQSCERITLDDTYEAELQTTADGLALLTPKDNLVPLNFARFATGLGRLRSSVAVSGYSFEGALSAPTVTYGTLEDIRGLTGDDRVQRLDVGTLDGDIGGPVLNMSGAVTGILQPVEAGGRALPEGTMFATKSTEVARFLSENGVTAAASEDQPRLAAEELLVAAADMTVLVSCW
ncbi:serine protease [uncultured Litoreibacter sp.]|uniref:serine protease n=1 Tax=uncultured Litoreibacter sp. TaxID=1392394 RepID=UPI00260CFE3E|nr:serine protease [uncultured Litoreibacter sp.]